MTTITGLLLFYSPFLSAPVMEEVPWYCNQRLAACSSLDGTQNVLVVQTHPAIEVSRWSPRTARRSWSWSTPGGSRISSAAVCSIRDQNADGDDDWALVHACWNESYEPTTSFVTIGCGRTGAPIRSVELGVIGRHVTVCHVRAAGAGPDLVIGCPKLGGEGALLWLRCADLSVCGRTNAPEGAREFGGFVTTPSVDDPDVWIGAPRSSPQWAVWTTTSPDSDPRVLVRGTRERSAGDMQWDFTRFYGCSVSASREPRPLRERTIAVGARGYPADGRAASGVVDAWQSAAWVDGPRGVFGTHFGEVVLVVEDIDGDCKPDWVVTDPMFAPGWSDDHQFSGAIYLVLSSEEVPRLLGVGPRPWGFLGIGLVAVGDLDEDGFEELAVLALPRHARDPHVEIWSVKRLVCLRSLSITGRTAR